MRTAHLVLALVFALFAALQWNDPDPWLWIPAYGAVSVLFGLAYRGRYPRKATAALAFVLTLWLLALVPDALEWMRMGMPNITGSMKATEQHIELMREFLGLMLAVIALAWLLRAGRTAPKS